MGFFPSSTGEPHLKYRVPHTGLLNIGGTWAYSSVSCKVPRIAKGMEPHEESLREMGLFSWKDAKLRGVLITHIFMHINT